MANISLRNPQFKSVTLGVTENSATCQIKIDGVIRYFLTKNRPSTGGFSASIITLNFDISELARDYLKIEYQSNYVPQTIEIETDIITYTGKNAQGTIVQTLATIEDVGFEAYGTFKGGINPEVPFRPLPSYLINPSSGNALLGFTFDILVPDGEAGFVPYINSSGVSNLTYTGSAVNIVSPDGVLLEITRANCSKYTPKKITFINKYGAQQDIWFFLKNSKAITRSNEGFKSNIIEYPSNAPATYNTNNASNKVFNTQGKQTHTFSSGYYPEYSNAIFEELLLSEYVWINEPNDLTPVKVKNSSISFKTKLNEKLIEYSMEFEEAFDYINNIR